MGLFKIRTALVGLSSLLLAASTNLFAASVDSDFGDNQNDFEYYWYYYDDNAGVGKNDRPQIAPTTKASVIDVVSKDSVRNAFGNTADTWKVKVYTFTTGKEGDNKYAICPFTMGSTWTASYGKATPYVGIGTMLCADKDSINLTGAKSVTFKIKSCVKPMTVNFKVQTKAIDDYSMVANPSGDAFGYYSKTVPVTTTWASQTVNLADLAQPISWCKEFTWDFSSGATKLAWEVPQQLNATALPEGAKDTLCLDDITIDGYTFISKTVWSNITATKPASILFSDFETDPKNQANNLFYWYAYNDAEIGGTSKVDAGAAAIEGSKQLALDISATAGSGGSSAPAIKFTFGAPINQAGTMVNGFVGIGINTYDSINCKYWDAKTSGVTSIYFEYTYQGDAKYLTLEISDTNDVGDSKSPARKDKRGKGVVWYKNLLPTGDGVWAKCEIPLSQLSIHGDWVGAKAIPLDLSAITKLQWKVQGGEGQQGQFAIDNIYFPGATNVKVGTVPVTYFGSHPKASAFHVSYLNGKVNVNLNNTTALSNGRINLVNAKGAVVSSQSIAKTADVAASFSSRNLSSGMYFVNLRAIDANGKAVTMQSPVSIVK
jgi:hypothetical protein